MKKQPSAAVDMYKKACDLGNGDSCTSAADMLLRGDGITKDQKSALKVLDKSCSAGNSWNCSKAKSIRSDASKPAGKKH